MKRNIKNIIIALLIIAVFAAAVFFLSEKALLAVVIVLQVATLLAIGGTNVNIDKRKNHDEEN